MEVYQETLFGKPEAIKILEKKELDRRFADPRPDKTNDHEHWQNLLWNCWHLERDLYYLLHGVRCGGGELLLTNTSLRLTQGEWNAADWEDVKEKRLTPFRDKLVNIFKLSRTGRVIEGELPAGIFDKWR